MYVGLRGYNQLFPNIKSFITLSFKSKHRYAVADSTTIFMHTWEGEGHLDLPVSAQTFWV